MLVLLSPARTIAACAYPGVTPTKPVLFARTQHLAAQLKELSPWQLESFLKINPELALRAFEAYQSFDPHAAGFPALLAYRGLAYQNLDAAQFTPEDFAYANDHLRILSAFYGILRPADGILPYRLEFLCKWRPDGDTLYSFWGNDLCRAVFSAGETVVSLASGEYERTIVRHLLPGNRFLTCRFLLHRRGKLLCLATAAKAARGQMARFIVKNRIDAPAGLMDFSENGFSYSVALSSDSVYTFLQK